VGHYELPAAEVVDRRTLAVLAFQRPHQIAPRHQPHESLGVIDHRPLLTARQHGILIRQALEQAIDRQGRGTVGTSFSMTSATRIRCNGFTMYSRIT